jgi:hypothetical protein
MIKQIKAAIASTIEVPQFIFIAVSFIFPIPKKSQA